MGIGSRLGSKGLVHIPVCCIVSIVCNPFCWCDLVENIMITHLYSKTFQSFIAWLGSNVEWTVCCTMASGRWRAKVTSTGDFCFRLNTCERRRRSFIARVTAYCRWTTSKSKSHPTSRCRSGTLTSSPGMTFSVGLQRFLMWRLLLTVASKGMRYVMVH